MSSFTTPLVVSPEKDGRRWKLVRQFSYHIGTRYSKDILTVPKGFTTDFASSPAFLWVIMPPFGKYTKASVLHDYMYQSHCRTRQAADKIFYEAMLVEDTPQWKAKLMYLAVRWFGELAWYRKEKR